MVVTVYALLAITLCKHSPPAEPLFKTPRVGGRLFRVSGTEAERKMTANGGSVHKACSTDEKRKYDMNKSLGDIPLHDGSELPAERSLITANEENSSNRN